MTTNTSYSKEGIITFLAAKIRIIAICSAIFAF